MLPGVGILGIDESSLCYVEAFKERGFDIIAICGTNEILLKDVAEKFKITLFTTKIDLLLLNQNINLYVFLKSSPNLCNDVCNALQVAGKHVICSQYLPINMNEAISMYQASLKYSSLLSVAENPLRFSKNILAAKKLYKSGIIGSLMYIDCTIYAPGISKNNSTNDFEFICGGGLLHRYCIPIIDTIEHVISLSIVKVQCNFLTLNRFPDCNNHLKKSTADDYFNFFGEFLNGSPIFINGRTSETESFTQQIKIIGSLGRIFLENDGFEIFFNQPTEFDNSLYCHAPTLKNFPPVHSDYLCNYTEELFQIFSKGIFTPNKNLISNFYTFERSVYLRKVTDAAFKSSTSGRSIHLSEIMNSVENSKSKVEKSESMLSFKSIRRVGSYHPKNTYVKLTK